MTDWHTPEIRVGRKGPSVKSLVWDPCKDGETVFDLMGMRVLLVASEIKAGEIPTVTVTFLARLVEGDQPECAPTVTLVEAATVAAFTRAVRAAQAVLANCCCYEEGTSTLVELSEALAPFDAEEQR